MCFIPLLHQVQYIPPSEGYRNVYYLKEHHDNNSEVSHLYVRGTALYSLQRTGRHSHCDSRHLTAEPPYTQNTNTACALSSLVSAGVRAVPTWINSQWCYYWRLLSQTSVPRRRALMNFQLSNKKWVHTGNFPLTEGSSRISFLLPAIHFHKTARKLEDWSPLSLFHLKWNGQRGSMLLVLNVWTEYYHISLFL